MRPFVGLGAGIVMSAPCTAGPVICTTSLEAPRSADFAPVEVTTCERMERTSELIERRFFTWTASYDRGVDMVHQFTDLFGIALAGDGGNQLMGLGFPDQTVIWDAAAAGETARALLDAQSPVLPLRTIDVANGFGSSLASEGPSDEVQKLNTDFTPVQALW